jgi:aerobic-type carbon monoxide dehydrogenase small subunit (CoxS/CutS family)
VSGHTIELRVNGVTRRATVEARRSLADLLRGAWGNICRCTGYESIVRGVLLAAERTKEGE